MTGFLEISFGVLQEYNIDGHLLMAVKSPYCQPEVFVRVNGKHSKSFHVDVGLRQRCALSPLLFIIYINWMENNLSRTEESVTIRKCKISRLLFADDLVLLVSSESVLQHALNDLQLHVALLE